MITSPHHRTIEDLCAQLRVDIERGLTFSEVKSRLKKFGENKLGKAPKKKIGLIFLGQFMDPIIYILGIAMFLAFIFNEWLEGYAILVVILITVSIGFVMEWQANRSLEFLMKMAIVQTTVLRNGIVNRVKASYVVPGDIIILKPGDIVPADGRLVSIQNIVLKEAILTGESTPVHKFTDVLPLDTSIADQSNMIFKGTTVVQGEGKMIVIATGLDTQMGQIARLTHETKAARTPLEKKLSSLSKWLIWLTLILAGLIVISGYLQGKDLTLMIETGMALAVAAIPEGLPIVATISLARGMKKLSRKKVIIKKLEAVQTLGETTVICTDKTGTLTEDKMSVHKIVFKKAQTGTWSVISEELDNRILMDESFKKLLKVAILCNNVQSDRNNNFLDSIEVSLLNFAEKLGYSISKFRSEHLKLGEIPFSHDQKLMFTLHQENSHYLVCAKGALESLVDCCDRVLKNGIPEAFINKAEWTDTATKIASEGLRTLAFAYKESIDRPLEDTMNSNLILIGLIGFLDPPRSDVKDAIQIYHQAGIKVVMITGDHPNTARKIAEDIGLIKTEENEEIIVHGKDLQELGKLSNKAVAEILDARVFARMVPAQKLDLVNFYQKHNAVVGMIGDGLNDAPALKQSDIGIAMGIRGSEAAKSVADVILMDDKFTSTELAIRQGRTIFNNIRHFVVYLLSCNLAEIISVTIASLSGLPVPLLPLQILFLNLVTDIFPSLALGMGRGEVDIMNRPPRDPSEPIITRSLWISTINYGLCITAAVIGITLYSHYILDLPSVEVNNMAFYTLILAQLLHVFNMPHRYISFFNNEVTRNLWVWGALLLSVIIMVLAYFSSLLREVLSLVALSIEQFILIGIFGIGALLLIQLVKRLGGTV